MVLKLKTQQLFDGFARQEVIRQIQSKPVVDPFDFVFRSEVYVGIAVFQYLEAPDERDDLVRAYLVLEFLDLEHPQRENREISDQEMPIYGFPPLEVDRPGVQFRFQGPERLLDPLQAMCTSQEKVTFQAYISVTRRRSCRQRPAVSVSSISPCIGRG